MTYEAWRISYQSSEQAARAAYAECARLQAKITEMEKQEPVAAQQRFQRQQEMMAVWQPWQTTELRKGRPARAVDVSGLNVEYRELYALPGAQNVPKEAIAKILTEVMDIAVSNGADSRSMPDEYVEVAAWLCGIPAQNVPGKGDDIPCVRCGAIALDTGLECNECGFDNYEFVTGKPFSVALEEAKP